MNRYFIITFSILPVIVIAGVTLLFVFDRAEVEQPKVEGIEKDLQLYAEIREMLLKHYDGELSEKDLRDHALMGLASGTGDRYTRVLPPVEAREQDIDLGGTFYGIGVGAEGNEDGSIRVTGVTPGGGAELAGILTNDVIVAIDGETTLGKTYESSVNRIRSEVEGSEVRLTLRRGGDTKRGDDPKSTQLEVTVKRQRIEQRSVHDVHIEERDGRRFGYLAISEFSASTTKQFKEAITELAGKGAQAFIVDIRGNGGGRVDAATGVVDALIAEKDKLITFTQSSNEANRENDRKSFTQDEESVTDLPVVLLVDHNSASASEIVAGALRDHGRAYIIGERTYGKGVVQSIYKLKTDPAYTLNITTTQYFTPLGRRVQTGKLGEPGGIQPDLEFKYAEGEQSRVVARMGVRRAIFNRDELAKTSQWWNYNDRMLNAAFDVLAGKPVSVK